MPDPKPKILFVDDEESILRGVKLNLGRTYDISTASSGRDALSLLEEAEPFQVIVSDFAMPGMNGADFLEKVREQDKEVVTLLLTGLLLLINRVKHLMVHSDVLSQIRLYVKVNLYNFLDLD